MTITDLEINDVTADDLAYDPFEVNTLQLAQILGVTRESVNRWAREEIIAEARMDSFGGGRPARVFNLYDVLTHFQTEGEGYSVYGAMVGREIERREDKIEQEAMAQYEAMKPEPPLDQAVRETREAEISEREVLIDRIDHLEHLVVSLAAKMKDGEPITAEESLEILDIVFRRYDVRGS